MKHFSTIMIMIVIVSLFSQNNLISMDAKRLKDMDMDEWIAYNRKVHEDLERTKAQRDADEKERQAKQELELFEYDFERSHQYQSQKEESLIPELARQNHMQHFMWKRHQIEQKRQEIYKKYDLKS